jgi:4-carboxymuconolactone decarboxylase
MRFTLDTYKGYVTMSDDAGRECRIGPVPPASWNDHQREVIRDLIRSDGSAPNVIATFVRHPDLCQRWIALSRTLLHHGLLPNREREIVILRIAWRLRSDYEWRQHASRVDAQTLEWLSDPSANKFETELEQDLVRSVDEYCGAETIGPTNWADLTRHYDEQQLLEVVFLCTQYRALANILNILRVEPDTELPLLPPLRDDEGEGEVRR